MTFGVEPQQNGGQHLRRCMAESQKLGRAPSKNSYK